MEKLRWPYVLEYDQEETLEADVLVLGGGIAGSVAAINAAKKGKKVLLVEKGGTRRSGAGGSGCDHWESAATNPGSTVTPEKLAESMIDDNDGFNNGISHYIECREGYDRLLEIESMGGKIRDSEDEFLGAAFRDPETKFMYAYDYQSRHTLRIWGSTFKPAMYQEMKRLGVRILDRVMATSLLTENGKVGGTCIGATGVHTRTGKFYILRAKATVMAMSRPARLWLFSPEHTGLSEFRPTQCVGDGHAMGWRAGAEFNMMEKSVGAEFSAAGRSYPPYGAGNNHNTWYGASLIDSEGREIPYLDRDKRELQSPEERFFPSVDQAFFLKGGNIEQAKYAYDGPETVPFDEMLKRGYKLPFYADLTNLPPLERKVIWGMMVGEEGKTKIPILGNYTKEGFDPEKHVLQCYGSGWTSASFSPNERQLFGLPGGFFNDWNLMSSMEGLFVAGDALFASNCYGHAAATGGYAGRHGAAFAEEKSLGTVSREQVDQEKSRVYRPLEGNPESGIGWKELNQGIVKTMQHYCGAVKIRELLELGRETLTRYEKEILPQTVACNPHELVRLLEVHDILTVGKIIMEASLQRTDSVGPLNFQLEETRGIHEKRDENCFIVIRNEGGDVRSRRVPLNYYGDLKVEYEKVNGQGVQA